MTDYKERLKIDCAGSNTKLYTKSGECISNGYTRVVIGERGPYIEFTKEQIINSTLHIPKDCAWKMQPKYADRIYYYELRTNSDNVKVYYQKRCVEYADYKIDYMYITPFDLYDESGDVLIEPLKKTEPVDTWWEEPSLKKKAEKIKISKAEKSASFDMIHNYFTGRFKETPAITKKDFEVYKGKKTLCNTKIKEKDKVVSVCVMHTGTLSGSEHISVSFKYIALRELEKVCKKYYLVKERREPVIVELEYMFNKESRKKINEEYN